MMKGKTKAPKLVPMVAPVNFNFRDNFVPDQPDAHGYFEVDHSESNSNQVAVSVKDHKETQYATSKQSILVKVLTMYN